MDWASIIGAAVSGALAGGIVALVGRYRPTGGTAQGVIFAIAFTVLGVVASEWAVPLYRSYALEKSLLDLPAYREIALADPDAYSRIVAALKQGANDRARLSQLWRSLVALWVKWP
jgi:hypothetical protein